MSFRPNAPAMIRSQTSLEAEDHIHARDDADTLELESDLYTNAFISTFSVPGVKKGGGVAGGLSKMMPLCAMLGVTLIQLLMAWAVYLHVQNDLIEVHSRPLLTAYEMFVGTNITIPLHTTEALCGEWEDHEMKDFAMGPLSTMKMKDGSVFAPDDSYSFFYNVKQPTRTWDYARLGDERSVLDDVMFIISEGVTLNPFTPSGYSLLFILTLSVFYLNLIVEFRQIFRFAGMLIHFVKDGGCGAAAHLHFSKDTGKFTIMGVSTQGHLSGWIAVGCRLALASVLAWLGTMFLLYTTLKIDLILNGLALVFLLDLDAIVFQAVVPSKTKQFIDDIEPVFYKDPGTGFFGRASALISGAFVMLMFPVTFLLAMYTRSVQIGIFKTYFKMTAAVCLFAGPTTPFARHDIVHPVAGFCDSILGVKCAPHVEPMETLDSHGYCVVTDQTVTNSPTLQFYLDDPHLFANRYNEDGSTKSWVEWGDSDPSLFKSGLWMDGPYQDILRKNCAQMYQKAVKPDDVIVDDDVGETMDGAPFECARDEVFNAVFGEVEKSVDKMTINKMIQKVRPLDDPLVVAAVDKCNKPKISISMPAEPSARKSADESISPAAPAPASAQFDVMNFNADGVRRQQHRHGRLRHKKHHKHHHGDEGHAGTTWFTR
mmetsp:Transcript_57055/g.107479  ORF Transcript_57055/g.107479 Transcript_57055/m.107479 type:complete len:655 (-) Transcript_57055:102-2066(-)